MYKLERCMLKREADIYKLKYAWLTIKTSANTPHPPNRNISFRPDNSLPKNEDPWEVSGSGSKQSIQIQNRQLYLQYVGKVLKAKQLQLIELEEYLFEHREQAQRQQIKKNVLNPLTLKHQAEIINSKVAVLKQFIHKYARTAKADQEYQDFAKSIDLVEQACKQSYNTLSEDIVAQYQQFNRQRNQLSSKLSKICELEGYENYLNQLQAALEQKEYQIIAKQKMQLQQTQSLNKTIDIGYSDSSNSLSQHNNSQKYNTYAEDKYTINVIADNSMRRRTKIFQNRAHGNNLKVPLAGSITPPHLQSSKIMEQHYSQNQINNSKDQKSSSTLKQFHERTVQTQFCQSVQQVSKNLSKQKLTIKFIRLWLKYSEKFTKNTQPNYKKLMNLYLWRLNALYDQNLAQKIEQNLTWPRKITPLGDTAFFNYTQLSLRKKKYVQMFFHYEQKRFQRKKIIQALQSVLRNKNRRERTAVVLIFRKYREHSRYLTLLSIVPSHQKNPSQSLILTQRNQPNVIDNGKTKIIKQNQSEPSQFIHAFNKADSKVGTANQPRARSKTIDKQSSKNLSTNLASQGQSKAKLVAKENLASNVDMHKLKEYIKSQEQTEARLAIQCAQTSSVYRLILVLTPITHRIGLTFFVNATRLVQTAKINNLERSISCCEFKWQLFMAKARLALTNNSNKVAHLQQLIFLTGGKALS